MQVTVESQTEGVVELKAAGAILQSELGLPSNEPLSELLEDGAFQGSGLMDLSAVDRIDSSGVSWLLSCHRQFRKANGQLILHSAPPIVSNVFKLLNLHTIFQLVGDRTEARRMAGQS